MRKLSNTLTEMRAFESVAYKKTGCIWILGFQWMMQIHRYNYLQDSARPVCSFKPNKEWADIALTCYKESEKRTFYMKWLVVNRWVTLVLVYRCFYKNKPYAARNKGFRTYVDSTLRPWKRNYYSIIKKCFGLKV